LPYLVRISSSQRLKVIKSASSLFIEK